MRATPRGAFGTGMLRMDREDDERRIAELLRLHPGREAKLLRIAELQKKLGKWEREDEENDPELIRGHIALTRGFRAGCGVFWLCLAAMSGRAVWDGHRWAWALVAAFALAGVVGIARGLLYRPDPAMILAAYEPHRKTEQYRSMVRELELLGRAIAQDVAAEDAGGLHG